jgi:hypothetical protein
VRSNLAWFHSVAAVCVTSEAIGARQNTDLRDLELLGRTAGVNASFSFLIRPPPSAEVLPVAVILSRHGAREIA